MTKQSPILQEFHTVNTAVTWEEGYSSYPGRSHGRMEYIRLKKIYREKSAEVIVVSTGNEGLNNLKSWKTRRCRHRRLSAENITVYTKRWLPMKG
jgi:hypothetical protein